MMMLGRLVDRYQRAMASMLRIKAVLREEPQILDAADSAAPIRGEIAFRHTRLPYTGTPVPTPLSLRLPAGRPPSLPRRAPRRPPRRAGGESTVRERRDMVDLDQSRDVRGSLRFRCGTHRAGGWAGRGGGGDQGRPHQPSHTAIESVHYENGEISSI